MPSVWPSVWLIAPGALVAAIALVLMLRGTGDARQYTMHMLAAALVLPSVLLIVPDRLVEGRHR